MNSSSSEGPPPAWVEEAVEATESLALELACEDWYGIWEVLWSCNVRFPDAPAAVRAQLALQALRRLRDADLITFIRVPWPGPDGRQTYDAIPLEDVERELEGSGWRELPPRSEVWFGATPEGERAYRSRTGWPKQQSG
jgi:hypothetical protein